MIINFGYVGDFMLYNQFGFKFCFSFFAFIFYFGSYEQLIRNCKCLQLGNLSDVHSL